MEFFVRSDVAVLRQMTSSLRMRTERSLRSDVKFLERFVGKIIKSSVAFLNLVQNAVEQPQLLVIRATAENIKGERQ
jgi:hypothetical protein